MCGRRFRSGLSAAVQERPRRSYHADGRGPLAQRFGLQRLELGLRDCPGLQKRLGIGDFLRRRPAGDPSDVGIPLLLRGRGRLPYALRHAPAADSSGIFTRRCWLTARCNRGDGQILRHVQVDRRHDPGFVKFSRRTEAIRHRGSASMPRPRTCGGAGVPCCGDHRACRGAGRPRGAVPGVVSLVVGRGDHG